MAPANNETQHSDPADTTSLPSPAITGKAPEDYVGNSYRCSTFPAANDQGDGIGGDAIGTGSITC